MSAAWLMENLVTWWLHAAVLVTVGIVGARALGWREPQSRLRLLQVLLAAALLLPVVEPWAAAPAFRLTLQSPPTASPIAVPGKPPGSTWTPSWQETLLAAIAVGVVARLGYLLIGLLQLRRWRRRGEPIRVEGMVAAEVRVVDGLRGPASFGWRRPVILLPRTLVDENVRAVALQHEYQHVIRRDWLESMIEQAVAALLWFHPAVWWLLERLQLAREQAVDAAVAGTGPAREHYLKSLLVSAGVVDYPALPATHFVRRRHLVERVALLTEERPMSFRHLALAALSLTAVTIGAIITVSGYVPLQAAPQPPAPPQARSNSQPVHLMEGRAPMDGVVTVEVTMSPEGETLDARVISGPDALRKRALARVLNMRHPAEVAARRTMPVTVEFTKAPYGAPPPPPPPPPPPVEQAEFQGIDYDGLTPDQQQRVLGMSANFRKGQRFSQEQLDQLTVQLKVIDPNLRLGKRMYTTKESSTGFGMRLRIFAGQPAIPDQIKVGASAQEANLVSKAEPVYPALARQARIQGVVRLTIHIAKDGSVERLETIAGHPLLLTAAQAAVQQYRYRPTLLNGQPVAVQTTVDVLFKLDPQ